MTSEFRDQQIDQTSAVPVIKTQSDSTGGWIAPIIVAIFTIIWCLLIYKLIGDRPADWKYGVTPYIPGQSIISTQQPVKGITARQVELPSTVKNRKDADDSTE